MNQYTEEQLALMAKFVATTNEFAAYPASEEVGIFTNVSHEEYHRRQLLTASKSILDYFDKKSPAHYKAYIDGLDRKRTPALEFGGAFHMSILEPQRFLDTYIVEPDHGDQRYKENKAIKAAWLATNGPAIGQILISQEDMNHVIGMMCSVMRHPAASKLVINGTSEVTLRWKDKITGVACKSRADYWREDDEIVVDLKSCETAGEDEFAKATYKYGYHRQDAMYRDGFFACGKPIKYFAIIAVEKVPPYACAVYTLDEDAVSKGYSSVRRDMDSFAECIRTNNYPSYGDGIRTLSLPSWAV